MSSFPVPKKPYAKSILFFFINILSETPPTHTTHAFFLLEEENVPVWWWPASENVQLSARKLGLKSTGVLNFRITEGSFHNIIHRLFMSPILESAFDWKHLPKAWFFIPMLANHDLWEEVVQSEASFFSLLWGIWWWATWNHRMAWVRNAVQKGVQGHCGGNRLWWCMGWMGDSEKHEHDGSIYAVKLTGPGHKRWLAADVLDQP